MVDIFSILIGIAAVNLMIFHLYLYKKDMTTFEYIMQKRERAAEKKINPDPGYNRQKKYDRRPSQNTEIVGNMAFVTPPEHESEIKGMIYNVLPKDYLESNDFNSHNIKNQVNKEEIRESHADLVSLNHTQSKIIDHQAIE